MNELPTHLSLEKVVKHLAFATHFLVRVAYRFHTMQLVKTKVIAFKVGMAVIPDGCTKFPQPADLPWD